jgi:hypothetical protein
MELPQSYAQTEELGCDLNRDGEVDNQMGRIFGAAHAACQTLDTQVATNAAFQLGTLINLYDVEYEPSLMTSQMAGLRAFIGAHDAGDGLGAPDFYMGQGRFTVSLGNGGGMGGSIQDGGGDFGPNDAIVQLSVLANQPPIVFPLQRGSLSGTFTAATIQSGKLCGAIDAQVVRTMLIPQFADFLSVEIKRRAACSNTFESLFDDDHSCATDPACVPSSPDECHCISASEVENNSIIRSLFSPDLDLDPHKTNPFVSDRNDPTYYNDALSFGVGITANAATFPLP